MRCSPTRLDRPCPLRWIAGVVLGLTVSSVSPCRADYDWDQLQLILAPGADIETIHQTYGTTTMESLPPLYRVTVPEGTSESELATLLQDDPAVLAVEYAYNNETPEGTRQMVVAALGGTIQDYLDQEVSDRLLLSAAHAHTTGENVLVAVLDSGVLTSHPALADLIEPGGWDFVSGDGDPSETENELDDDGDGQTDEGAGHGTMVAGIIHLVAPGARILPIRVLDDEGRGDSFHVATGIRWALDHGADVINISLGMQEYCAIVEHELALAAQSGVPIVGAAGNDSENYVLFPARDHDVLAVTALDAEDVKADFSNYHARVDLSAPGVGIISPYIDGLYAAGAGTSFAAPFVSGQCALIRSLNHGLSKKAIVDIALSGVTWIYQLEGNQPFVDELGTGRFDAQATWRGTPAAAGVEEAPGRVPSIWLVTPNPSRSTGPVHLRFVSSTDRDPRAEISLDPPERIRIVDAVGRTVRSLLVHSRGVVWDGRNEAGLAAPSGAYFVQGPGRMAGARILRID